MVFGCARNTYPSSLITSFIVCIVDLYLTTPGVGWGPCIRLLVTSHGVLETQATLPAVNPTSNL